MTLRFRQSLRSAPVLGSCEPEREKARFAFREPDPEPELRRKRTFVEEGGIALIGLTGAWSSGSRAQEEPSRIKREARAPKWLEGRFRPRNLTLEGQRFLERMDPYVVRRQGPVDILVPEPWASLRERMAYLQRKYLALDMVRKGFAVETDGRFWPWPERFAARDEESPARVRRCTTNCEPPMEMQEMVVWLGAFREASWDQLRALHPDNQAGIDRLVEYMVQIGAAERRRVEFGQGTLSTIRLTDRYGMNCLKAHPDGKDLIRRGFGNRGTGPGFGEYHEQAVGDAIGYFTHELQADKSEVTGITLDSALRREYLGSPKIPDLRVEFKNDFGHAHWDVEVVGIGRGYRNSKAQADKLANVTVRGFDPAGRSAASRLKDVGVSR